MKTMKLNKIALNSIQMTRYYWTGILKRSVPSSFPFFGCKFICSCLGVHSFWFNLIFCCVIKRKHNYNSSVLKTFRSFWWTVKSFRKRVSKYTYSITSLLQTSNQTYKFTSQHNVNTSENCSSSVFVQPNHYKTSLLKTSLPFLRSYERLTCFRVTKRRKKFAIQGSYRYYRKDCTDKT